MLELYCRLRIRGIRSKSALRIVCGSCAAVVLAAKMVTRGDDVTAGGAGEESQARGLRGGRAEEPVRQREGKGKGRR